MSETPRKFNKKSSKPKTPQKRKQALEKSFETIRERLHLSALPDWLPCRETEFADIYQFVRDKVVQKIGGCMYLSGVPGTGKTATVKQAIKHLSSEFAVEEKRKKSVKDYDSINEMQSQFTYVEVNGMKITDPQQVYQQFYKQLTGERVTSEHACNLLNDMFGSTRTKKIQKPIVILVDELDLLLTKKQTVIYNLFDWSSNSQSGLIVVAIANTMDLPERLFMPRVASRLGLTRVVFQPYSHQQLALIIQSRVQDEPLFEGEAIEFVARKVAALSGDARRALDICRRATEMANEGVVGMATVDAAIKEMFLAPKSICVRNSSQQEKLFLHSILSEFHRTGVEEAVLKNVYKHHVSLARLESLPPPTLSQILRMSSKFNSCRLLITDHARNDVLQKIRLNIAAEDLLFALKQESY